MSRFVALLLLVALFVSACSSGTDIDSCDDVVTATLALFQDIIDTVDEGFASMSVEEFLATKPDLPDGRRFADEAERIDVRAVELGCSVTDTEFAVRQGWSSLSAESEVGRLTLRLLTTDHG
ncbi:MAG: hypothetical protein R2823_06060 [Acidimicrobiia bacterium]